MRIANQRKTDILTLLKDKGEISIKELAKLFDVSPLTIRRDIDQLENSGIKRYHGKAKFIENSEKHSQKQRCIAIAKAAAEMICNNDTIFINSSSTALLVLSQIENKYLTAITNNGKALSMPIDPRIHLVLCGGDISFPKEALTGEFAISNLNKVTATRCIMGISGISQSMGLSTQNLSEVAINNTMLARTTGEKIIVADSSKINYDCAFSSGELSLIDTLITDTQADSKFIKYLTEMGINVITVDV